MKKFTSFIAKTVLLSFFFLTAVPAVLPAIANNAHAQGVPQPEPVDADNNAFVDTMCNALALVQGNAGKAFAAFAIISLGIGFFTGKISWGLMIGVAMGIAAMFGAPTIVNVLSPGNSNSCEQ